MLFLIQANGYGDFLADCLIFLSHTYKGSFLIWLEIIIRIRKSSQEIINQCLFHSLFECILVDIPSINFLSGLSSLFVTEDIYNFLIVSWCDIVKKNNHFQFIYYRSLGVTKGKFWCDLVKTDCLRHIISV